MRVKLKDVIVKGNRRQINPETVKELAKSISEIGLLNPITINENNVLIAGRHRLEAFRLLGRKTIEARVAKVSELQAELIEIDENLVREELHYIDRGRQLLRRKEIYEELYPETKATTGKELVRKRWDTSAESAPVQPSFAQDISAKTGRSERVIQEEVQIARDLSPDVQEVIKQADLPKRDAIRLARYETQEQSALAEKIATGKAKSVVDARRLLNKERVKTAPPLEGKYRVIYADPPWKYGDERDGATTGATDHYPTMSIEELCNLPVKKISDDNAVLFLWVTSPLLEECFEVIKAWGFKYKSSFVWDKVKHNMGHYNSVRHELLLICTRGSCTPDNVKLFDSVQSIERTTHSAKPEEFREIIDTLYIHGNKIELFARRPAKGWEVWGNEPSLSS